MSEIRVPIYLTFICGECAKELTCNVYDEEILVDPCSDCLEAHYKEGFDDGHNDGYDEGYSDAENEDSI